MEINSDEMMAYENDLLDVFEGHVERVDLAVDMAKGFEVISNRSD